MKFSWLAVFLSILSAFYRQELTSQPTIIKTYTVQDGLVMNRVRGFHQDASGFMWIYTWDGLSRFEGYRFRNYIGDKDLTHGMINDMVEYPDGSLYIALNDGSVDAIKNLEVQKDTQAKGAIINTLHRDAEGNVFAGTDFKGIYIFNKGKILPVSKEQPGNSVLSMVRKDDLLFIANLHNLQVARIFSRSDNDSIYRVVIIQDWPSSADYEKRLFLDQDGRILLGTQEGLKQIVPKSDNPYSFSLEDSRLLHDFPHLRKTKVFNIQQSSDGTYWMGTDQGLIKLTKSNQLTLLTKKDNLASDVITALFLDKSETLWIGTDIGFSILHTTTTIAKFTSPACTQVTHLLPVEDGKLYCICNHKAVYLLDSVGNLTNEFISNPVNGLLFANGLLLANGNLNVIQGKAIEVLAKMEEPEFQNPFSTRLAATCKDNIYWSANDLVFCYSPEGSYHQTGFTTRVEAIVSFNDSLMLLGTWDLGLYLAAPEKESCDIVIRQDLSKWLPSPEVRSLMVARNNDIWVGTRYYGIVRLKCDPEFEKCETEFYRMSGGLTSNWVTTFAEDNSGNIWVGTISGIDKLVPDGDTYRVFSFSKIYGFYDVVNHIAVSSTNRVWAGLVSGYAYIKENTTNPLSSQRTYLTEVILGGQNELNSIRDVILPYDKNNVHFEFASPDYVKGNQLQFTYRLLGSQDTMWSAPETNHSINYGSLKPGSYRFEVVSHNWNGERGIPTGYSFQIKPPFWQQAWFVALVFIATCSILYGLYRFRIKQIQRLQVIRDRIATDLHDEIGSSLSHVNILSEIGKQAMQKAEQPVDIFERIGNEAQYSSEALDDIIWSVKSRADVIGDVVARMRQYATELFGSSGTSFRIKENISSEHALGMEFRRDLYLAYKELLRNIHRHASASQVDIEITVNRQVVRLQVDDNGKGFDINSPTQRNGLANIKTRARRWQGNATWDSQPGKGTHVVVEMKHS